MKEPGPKGIVISGGRGNVARGNTIIGFETGVHIDGGTDNVAESNVVISVEAAHMYSQLQAAICASTLPPDQSARLLQALDAMRQSTGQPTFAQRYKDFMAVIADHMQILGPAVVGLLPGLAALL